MFGHKNRIRNVCRRECSNDDAREVPMITWQERFNIGVESIDKAHQELFRIANKLHRVVRTSDSNIKWTAAQTIKYLHSYTLRHFQDEEAYMRSINFRDYEAHKTVHATMRERIIPRLCSRLEQEDYSAESIEFFLDVLEKWLTRHILGHDREIVQKTLSDAPVNGAGKDDAPGRETASGSVSGGSASIKTESSSPERAKPKRSVLLLAMTLVIFVAAYAAGGLLVKKRVDKLTELQASSRSEEKFLARLKAAAQAEAASLAELKAAVRAEEASLAELKSWGLRLTTLPDGTRAIILPKGMKYERHGKIEAGEYADFEGIVVQADTK